MVVVGKARFQVFAEGLDAAGRPLALGLPLLQVDAHRLAVAPSVAGDGRDRPPPLEQRMDLHVILLCEHSPGVSLRIAGFVTRDRR